MKARIAILIAAIVLSSCAAKPPPKRRIYWIRIPLQVECPGDTLITEEEIK